MKDDRYSHDERQDFAQDFAFDTAAPPDRDTDPSNAPAPTGNSGAGATPSTTPRPTHARRVEDQAHDRDDDRNVVGIRGRRAPSHRLGRATPPVQHPELERAAFRAALDMAWTSYREGDRATVSVHLAAADRLARGRVG